MVITSDHQTSERICTCCSTASVSNRARQGPGGPSRRIYCLVLSAVHNRRQYGGQCLYLCVCTLGAYSERTPTRSSIPLSLNTAGIRLHRAAGHTHCRAGGHLSLIAPTTYKIWTQWSHHLRGVWRRLLESVPKRFRDVFDALT